MSSPAKRRKLDSDGGKPVVPTRGLEYFFAKQRQGDSSSSSEPQRINASSQSATTELSDEDYARKLQAEFDREALQPSAGRIAVTPNSADNQSDTNRQVSATVPDETSQDVMPSPRRPANTLMLQASGVTEDTISSTIPLDESPFTFDPEKYLLQLRESWKGQDGHASYALLTRCFVLVNGTTSRIKIVDTLVNCIRLIIEGDPSSLLPMVRETFYKECSWIQT